MIYIYLSYGLYLTLVYNDNFEYPKEIKRYYFFSGSSGRDDNWLISAIPGQKKNSLLHVTFSFITYSWNLDYNWFETIIH